MKLTDDYCRCVNKACPKDCARKQGSNSEYQSYCDFGENLTNFDECDNYIEK